MSDEETTTAYHLTGIVDAMTEAGDRRALWNDIGLPWAQKTEPVIVTDYDHFPRAFEPARLAWD
ncbi:MAG: hypothetical protein ACOC70_02335 [bacterium]